MTTRIRGRFPLTYVASIAMAETRIAVRAAPAVIRSLAPTVAWAAATIILGIVIGFAAVVLPPMGVFGIVALLGLILLWVMPEAPLVYPALIRKTFYVMLVTQLCVPNYYTVQFGGLPWISARRVATFALIAPFLLAISSSSQVRHDIAERLRLSPLILVCVLGFLVMACLSVLTSNLPEESISALTDAILTWYVPFLAAIYVVRNKDDSILMLKIVCFCALFNTAAGILEFRLQHRIFLDIFPKSMLDAFIDANPQMADFLDASKSFRNGMYRASSTFVTSLSFAEFEIMVIPIGLFFALHRDKVFERCLGWMVVIGGMGGILVSGSRGGYVGFLASTAAFVSAWAIRKAQTDKASLAPAFVGLSAALSFGTVLMAVLFTHRGHDMVLGGGAEAASTEGRWVQWAVALPIIKTNPITGHGFATGGADIDMSIDSYVISLLLETGVPGFVFFAGIACLPIWFGIRSYIYDLSESGALAGALACSFVAFAMYRLVLSQRENIMLAFFLLGLVVVAIHEYRTKDIAARQNYRQKGRSRSSYSRHEGGQLRSNYLRFRAAFVSKN
jgi:O-antigen ligase